MQRNHACWLLPAMLALTTAAAVAEGPPTPSQTRSAADPLDVEAAVPAVSYRSGLASYRRLSEDAPMSWREANDSVGRIGGWRAYAREANAPEARDGTTPATPTAAEAATVPTSKPMPGPHSGHPMH